MVHLKSDSEIEGLRVSADLVGRTLAEVARHIEVGVTTKQLDAVAEAFVRSHGAEPAFKGYRVGRNVFPATLCTSVNDEVVHGIPNDEPLQDGDMVSVDCGVVLNGFYGDSAYTFAVGTLSEENAELCRVTYQSLMDAITAARVGGRLGDIGHAVQARCEAAGFGVVRDLVGHGIGRSLHEEPSVPNFGRQGSGRKLKHGLTICIEPMVNLGTDRVTTDRDGWTVRAADGKPSAHYEHMVAVRRGGPDVLTTFEHIEAVLDTPPYAAPSASPQAGEPNEVHSV
ncbi:MAG: type I methionyl aminopeptidase [Rhodothermales bacterium]|nr:type I methionyl aminopeptidase [Rhodothermales bacterium]MBO6781402.1 type I methionyl aminopeptidase [Rhodothermales bacterium]